MSSLLVDTFLSMLHVLTGRQMEQVVQDVVKQFVERLLRILPQLS